MYSAKKMELGVYQDSGEEQRRRREGRCSPVSKGPRAEPRAQAGWARKRGQDTGDRQGQVAGLMKGEEREREGQESERGGYEFQLLEV